MPGVHVAHFFPMCLTTRNGLRHPKSPVMPRTSPTRFDAWSSRGGRPEWTLVGHPHVLGRRVVASEGARGTDCFIPVFTPPGKTYQQHALARGVWLTSCRPSVRG